MQRAPTREQAARSSSEGRAVALSRKIVEGRPLPTIALAVVVLLATWMGGAASGGYFAGGWTPVALFLAVLLLLVSLAGAPALSKSLRPGLVAAALLAAYAVWTLASLLWSPNAGEAWTGAGQTLLYLLVFFIALLLVSLGASRRWVLAVSVLGPALVAAFTLPVLGSRIEDLFESGRLVGSVGYYNGEAAFLMLPFWIGIYLGGSRRLNPLLRGAVLGGLVLSASVAILPQSRGAMVAMALSAAVFFLLSGKRLRGLIALAPVAAALFLAFPELNGVYLAYDEDGGSLQAAIAAATPAVWLGAAGAALYGVVWGLVDRWWTPSSGLVRLAGGVTLACILGGALIGGAVLQERVGSPVAVAGDKWEAFKTGDTTGQEDSRYLSASNNGRLPLWEVAWQDFKTNPVLGVGTRNYEATYYQLREEYAGYVRQAHSLPLEMLAERGAVGGILFFGFLGVCAVRGLWRRFGRLGSEGKAQAGALLAACAYWFVHSSAEWFWELPAITLVAFVYLAMLVSPWRGEAVETHRGTSALGLGSVGLAALALVVVLPLFAANHYLQQSRSAESPEAALSAVERARSFNPLDSRLARREAEVATEAGEWDRAEASYEEAIRLDPEHYGPRLLLGSYYERRGQFEDALREYEESRDLNPLQPDLEQNVQRMQSLQAV